MPYATPPGLRMAYHRDGTVVNDIDTANGITTLSSGQMQELNDEDNGTYSWLSGSFTGTERLAFIFPELRDVVGYFVSMATTGTSTVIRALEYSVDTTNGVDGTWVNIANPWVNAGSVPNPAYRTSIQAISALGVKGIRFSIDRNNVSTAVIGALHLYGNISAGQTPDRLRIWRPTDHGTPDAEISAGHLDWSDSAQASSATKKFRVKNNSATLTANNIIISNQVLTDGSPSIGDDFLYKWATDPDSAYATTLNIGNLAPGAISADIVVRRTTPSGAQLGAFAVVMAATATSWT